MRRLSVTVIGFGTLSWVLLALAWWRVVDLHATVHPKVLLGLCVLLVAVVLLDTAWIAHNRRIYRRKGPRRALPAPGAHMGTDRLGRAIVLPAAAVRSQLCVLSLDSDGTKRYHLERAR